MKTADLKSLFRTMRIPFLLLTPVSVFLGFSISAIEMENTPFLDFFLVLAGAICAHISVNTLNEYHDFRSGLDARTAKTPFSGGSGALVEKPEFVDVVLLMALASLAVTILIGVYFAFNVGLLVVPLGVAGVVIIVTYTQWLNRDPFLCLVAPGLGFGPLMVVGTDFVLTGAYSLQAVVVSLVPFFLASNLLLLNQFPDIVADESVGRRHFPIAYGIGKSTTLYGILALFASGTVLIGVYTGVLPQLSLISLAPLAITLVVFRGARKHAGSVADLIPYLGLNVAVTLLTPVFLGISILYS